MEFLQPHFFVVCLAAILPLPVSSANEFPRLPICSLQNPNTFDVETLQVAFRSEFCKRGKSATCDERWMNTKLFLNMALRDARIIDVGTISYMFGTIYTETETKNFSPTATEVIGDVNRNKLYVKEGFYGRGWIQLTYKDKYMIASKVLGKDLIANPDLALVPENAYEILFRGMNDGWIEVYRTSPNGAVARSVPIKLGDFVSATAVNYDLARSVINANCKKSAGRCTPPNIEYQPGLYIPPAISLDASSKASMAATKMEKILCQASPGKS